METILLSGNETPSIPQGDGAIRSYKCKNGKLRRVFTPEQKVAILNDIKKCQSVTAGLEKYQLSSSVYTKWRRQYEVGIRASLRNSKPVKSTELRRLETENRKLKEIVLNQSLSICELKKEMSLD